MSAFGVRSNDDNRPMADFSVRVPQRPSRVVDERGSVGRGCLLPPGSLISNEYWGSVAYSKIEDAHVTRCLRGQARCETQFANHLPLSNFQEPFNRPLPGEPRLDQVMVFVASLWSALFVFGAVLLLGMLF
jgi:hypothetical protein